MKMKNSVLVALCASLVASLIGCKGAKPIYLEADTGQVGAGATLVLEKTTGTGTLMMKATPDYPQGFKENVKVTGKVGLTTAPVWTLITEESNTSLVFAPSAKGWICESCAAQKLPSKWHIQARSD